MTDSDGVGATRDEVDARMVAEYRMTPLPEAMARRLDLLWRGQPPRERGRKPRFTLDEVVEAGIRVADASGLAGVTMRAVAKDLGAGAMSLYTYVPGRDELVDLMIDRVHADLALPDGSGPWRAEVEALGAELVDLHTTHPWLLDVPQWRLPLAPRVMDVEEALLRALSSTGIPAERVAAVSQLLATLVRGAARAALQERAAGDSTDDYWQSLSAFWADYFDVDRYPTMSKIWMEGGFEADQADLNRTLAPLLDGLENR